jgi:hypothetical protein
VTTNDSLPAIAEIETEEVNPPPKKKSFIRVYVRILLRKSWLIISTTLLTTTTAVVLSSSKSSTYRGNFYLLVEPITAAARLTNREHLTCAMSLNTYSDKRKQKKRNDSCKKE